jgi:XTP/dITP diphosphohydrolase
MKKIYFVTSNKGKQAEAKEKLSAIGFDVIQHNIGYPEIQADTLEEVALFGVEDIQKRFDQPFFIEDAGLFIDCLKSFPGVYSSYVFRTIGCKCILKILDGEKNRKATFRSIIAYKEPGKKPVFFVGECHGDISKKELGSHGFGFDPIFISSGETRTFAQMEIKEKNLLSHRGRSLYKLVDFFKKQRIENFKSL